jgi:hypothetical protein
VGAGNVCNFPIACDHAACNGDVVCAEPHVVVDYCTAAITNIPVPVPTTPPPGNVGLGL